MVKVSVSLEHSNQTLQSKNQVNTYLSLGNYLNFFIPNIVPTNPSYSFDNNSIITVPFNKENENFKKILFKVDNHNQLGLYVEKFIEYQIYINGVINTQDISFISTTNFEIEFNDYGSYNIAVVAIGKDSTYSQSRIKTVKIQSN